MKKERDPKDYAVDSALKVLQVLEALCKFAPAFVPARTIEAETGQETHTVFAALCTLEVAGYAEQSKRGWRATAKVGALFDQVIKTGSQICDPKKNADVDFIGFME